MSVQRPSAAERVGNGVFTLVEGLAMAVLIMAGGLLVGSMLPIAFGWSANAIVSGSMEPKIRVGDVVVTSPVDPQAIAPGHVVLFPDPDGGRRYIMHRVVDVTEDDQLVTRGDANQSADTMPLPRESVAGLGRLRVPYVGLPRLWFQTGNYPPLIGLAVLLTMATLVLVPRGSTPPPAAPAGAPRRGDDTPALISGAEALFGLDDDLRDGPGNSHGVRDGGPVDERAEDASTTSALISLLSAPARDTGEDPGPDFWRR